MSASATPGPDPFGLVGTTLADKFRVERSVAEGGFGVVYQCIHIALEKTVALKVLKVPTELSDSARRDFLDKFAQEAKTIARFEHPAIVRVLDFGTSPMPVGREAPWMVLEWIQGGTLADDLGPYPRAPRSPTQILKLLGPVFEAVAYAHEEGVAHRDLKPANMMLVRGRRGEESLRLLDFGIAKVMREDDAGAAASGMTGTMSQSSGFSPQYAAPEQVMGTRSGPWSDVHALGLIVTELLLGRPAYNHDDLTDLYADILGEPRPSPAKFGVDAGAWEPILARALSVRPGSRFGDAQSFFDALEAALPQARGPAEAAPAPVVQSAGPLVPVVHGTLAGPETGPTSPPRQSTVPPMVSTPPPTPPQTGMRAWALGGVLLGLVVLSGGVWALSHQDHAAHPPTPAPQPPTPAPQPTVAAPLPTPAPQPTVAAPQPTPAMRPLDPAMHPIDPHPQPAEAAAQPSPDASVTLVPIPTRRRRVSRSAWEAPPSVVAEPRRTRSGATSPDPSSERIRPE